MVSPWLFQVAKKGIRVMTHGYGRTELLARRAVDRLHLTQAELPERASVAPVARALKILRKWTVSNKRV
eukprot:53264-Amphidinium_carterae.2